MASLSISTARANLPALVDRVGAGEEIVLTRHGRPVAVLVSPDALRTRRATDALAAAGRLADLRRTLPTGHRSNTAGLTPARADELAAAVRAGRDR